MPNQSRWVIDFYEKANGRIPAREFLESLTDQEHVYVEKSFDRLQKYGRKLGRPYFAYLRDDIYELRVRTRNRQLRFLCFFNGKQVIIITHAIIKKGEKVPDSEIDKAIDYRSDYIRRHAEE